MKFEDYQKLIKEAAINIAIKNALIRGLTLRYMEQKVKELDIRKGDLIEVTFENVVDKCIYEGIAYSYFAHVKIRHFTTKRKPFKMINYYAWDILEDVKKLKELPE